MFRKTVNYILISILLIIIGKLCEARLKEDDLSFIRAKIYNEVIDNSHLIREKIEQSLKKKFEDYESFDLSIKFASKLKTMGGFFKRIRVKLKNVIIKDMKLYRAEFVANDVKIDMPLLWMKNKIKIVNSRKIDFIIEILEKDLNDFLKKRVRKTKVKTPRVDFRKSDIVLMGRTKWWIIKSKFKIYGNFKVKNEKDIYFYPYNLKLGIVSMPDYVVDRVVKKINPVYSLKTLPFDVKLKSIITTDDRMILTNNLTEFRNEK